MLDQGEFPAIVTGVALVEYVAFVMLAGNARRRSGIAAPAMSGDEMLERHLRVQYNTVEQLIVFLPALWLYAWFRGALTAAVIGVFFIIGRAWYAIGYLRDPASRGPGFLLGFLATIVLLAGGLAGAARRLF
jgi:glutathione S-transferase